jgi:hypothetical protein
MARASRTRRAASTAVSVDFTGIESRVLIPEGEYLFAVESVEQDTSSEGNKMLVWTFAIAEDGKLEGQTSRIYTPLIDTALWKLAGLLTALGQEVPDGPMDIELTEMVGLEMMGVVTHEDYNDRPQSRISDFYPADEAPVEEPPARGRRAKKDEPVEDEPAPRSRRGGRAAKEEESEEEKSTPASRRAARRAKKEEAEAPPARGRATRGKKKELDPIGEDEVQDMQEEELEALITEYDLDVDLSAARTLRKKAALVIDALEAADLLAAAD